MNTPENKNKMQEIIEPFDLHPDSRETVNSYGERPIGILNSLMSCNAATAPDASKKALHEVMLEALNDVAFYLDVSGEILRRYIEVYMPEASMRAYMVGEPEEQIAQTRLQNVVNRKEDFLDRITMLQRCYAYAEEAVRQTEILETSSSSTKKFNGVAKDKGVKTPEGGSEIGTPKKPAHGFNL